MKSLTRKLRLPVVVLMILLGIGAWVKAQYFSAPAAGTIVRSPGPTERPVTVLEQLPQSSKEYLSLRGLDLRSRDLRELDLMTAADVVREYASFDTRTIWPQKLPAGFSPTEILKHNQTPGLGVRSLHERGITGKGISVAVIDETMLVDHQEYAANVVHYEEIGPLPKRSGMHGPPILSILAGKTTGVAPDVKLYLFAAGHVKKGEVYFQNYARAIERVLTFNQQLPAGEKIRVISISIGWGPGQPGFEAIDRAVKEAKENGILVVCSSMSRYYDFSFHGLGRDPLSDPDDWRSYTPGHFWRARFLADPQDHPGRALLPMDSITTANHTSKDGYTFWRVGGWSWSIPYIAGLYALALQVQPDLPPQSFLDLLVSTGHPLKLSVKGRKYVVGRVVDPPELVEVVAQGK